MILGNGEIIWASMDHHRDLFFTAAGGCGSLGVITLLEMELMDAKKYVELHYIPVASVQDAVEQLRGHETEPGVDYMDGILFSMDRGVIMIGRLTDNAMSGRTRRFDRRGDSWFYLHVEEILQTQIGSYRETIPVESYLFRYDRGAFPLF